MEWLFAASELIQASAESKSDFFRNFLREAIGSAPAGALVTGAYD